MTLEKFSFLQYFHWLENWLQNIGVNPHVGVNLIIVSIVIVLFAYFAGKKYRAGFVKPETKLSFSNIIAHGVASLFEMTKSQIGTQALKFFWLMGGFFIFILFCNLWGLIPGFLPPTEEFSLTFGLGLISFLIYNFIGFKENGVGYLKHFLGPIIYIAPLIGAIELISHLVRPLTLGLRLFGNITGDHFVVSLFSEKIFPVIVPMPFMALGIFISVIQAFVFYQLSVVYIVGSASHD